MTSKVQKERVDLLLVQRGMVETREKAKRLIMAGQVYSMEVRVDKAGEKIPEDQELSIKGQQLKYVSRGGLKLEKALEIFDVSVDGKLMLDIGSSTGGFTDCALQNGAKHCYALDVGSNQLAWKIRSDERVTVMEKTNFRYVTAPDLAEGLPEFTTIDVSFISLELILPVLKTVLMPGGDVIALVKPQFEAGKEKVGKKGVIRDAKVHVEVLEKVASFATEIGFVLKAASYSPITGGEGNIEFLFHLYNPQPDEQVESIGHLADIVKDAHAQLK
ncbi:TlyA family RNA methyltransferase [Kurthia sibirica]|uniref:TlyA family rRNA (Cytidine-2'-O)-methyltransferase n=1 Tax=Kurthia sibirica TaxID=202750 RepID=A0A2U3ALW6_9BACL|nr:TlyA family RNA methyltransferase [Kurthia sibirica]PWI25502.1 TlyA family rRNA (cytidine-2'-O)-methyltransferase [Kurthia sibirica]GEK33979.1 putative rRNA methyltransferase YqxC [Kurthia sibirica]